jgi:TRAP-type C4-dicarboxylate transport system permease small subunit
MLKIFHWIYDNGIEWTVGLLFLVIVLLTGTQVFFRYVLSSPISWLEEFAQLLLVWAVMLGAAAGIKRNGHLRIEFLLFMTSGITRCVLALLINVLVGALAIAMIYYGFIFYLKTGGDYSTSLGFERNLYYLPVPVSGVLSLLFVVVAIARELRAARATPSDPGLEH